MSLEETVKAVNEKSISIEIFGLGYVGFPLTVRLASAGFQVTGIDISQKAIKVAIRNSTKHQLRNRAKFYRKCFMKVNEYKFDLIVSNPPYIKKKDIKNLDDDIKKFEPKLALDGGNDGLDVIKKVIYKSRSILKVKGMLALEIGNEQYKKVSKILISNKFIIRFLVKDNNDNVRCILSTLRS